MRNNSELDYRKISLHSFLNQESAGHRMMQKIGIDSTAQAKRAALLIDTLGVVGIYIAAKEKLDHEQNYENEFIRDEPVSLAHNYYLYDGKFYSYPFKHDLLHIENSIHPGERDGQTIMGFKRYQQLATDDTNQGGLWHSPPGKAGSEAPFNNIKFEAERLYLFFKTGHQESVHLDIKIRPEFPIKDFLDFVSGREPGPGEDAFYYLNNPFGIKNAEDFFFKLQHFSEYMELPPNIIAYVSRRHDDDRKVHFFSEIGAAVRNRVGNLQSLSQSSVNFSTADIASLTHPRSIEGRYYGMMREYMQQTGKDRIVLYGCSATNTVTRRDAFQNSITSVINQSSLAGSTMYGTTARLTGLFGSQQEGGSTMDCVQCPFCKNIVDAQVGDGKITCPQCDASVTIK